MTNFSSLTITSASVTAESFSTTSSRAYNISNSDTSTTKLTLGNGGDFTNSVSHGANDLIYVATGSSLTVKGPPSGSALGLVLASTGNFNVDGTLAITSAITNPLGGPAYGFNKTGAGTLTLGNQNTFGGTATLSSGTIIVADRNAFLNSPVALNYSGTTASLLFDPIIATNTVTLPGLSGSGSLALVTTGPSPTPVALTVGSNNLPSTYAGNLSGTGSLTKQGTGVLALSGTNSYTGTTLVNIGTLSLLNSSAAAPQSKFTVASMATLAFAVGDSANAFTGTQIESYRAGSTFANGAILGMDTSQASTPTTYSTAINDTSSGTLGLTKSGIGTLIVTGTNGYTGGTTVSGGTLVANNGTKSLGSGTTTVSGGVLAGSGATGGAVVVTSTGTITAGSGAMRTKTAGALTGDTVGNLASGNQAWNAGGTAVVKFADAKTTPATAGFSTAGSSYDTLTMGLLNLSALASKFNIVLTYAKGSTFAAPATGTQFKLVDATSGISKDGTTSNLYAVGANVTSLFALDASDIGLSNTAVALTVASDGGAGEDLNMTFTGGQASTPEPSTVVMVGAAGTVALVRRARRVGVTLHA